MKFKVNQRVYYFKSAGPFMGEIVAATVKAATKDLLTGHITYTVATDTSPFFGFWQTSTTELLWSKNLYSSRKKIEADYKEFLLYGSLSAKMDVLEKFLDRVMLTCAQKISQELLEVSIDGGRTSNTVTIASNKLLLNTVDNGVICVQEELEKIKAELAVLKKKIKTPKKKPVVKKEEAKK